MDALDFSKLLQQVDGGFRSWRKPSLLLFGANDPFVDVKNPQAFLDDKRTNMRLVTASAKVRSWWWWQAVSARMWVWCPWSVHRLWHCAPVSVSACVGLVRGACTGWRCGPVSVWARCGKRAGMRDEHTSL